MGQTLWGSYSRDSGCGNHYSFVGSSHKDSYGTTSYECIKLGKFVRDCPKAYLFRQQGHYLAPKDPMPLARDGAHGSKDGP